MCYFIKYVYNHFFCSHQLPARDVVLAVASLKGRATLETTQLQKNQSQKNLVGLLNIDHKFHVHLLAFKKMYSLHKWKQRNWRYAISKMSQT